MKSEKLNFRFIFIMVTLLLACAPLLAQKHTLSGRVSFADNGEAASFATVVIDELELRTVCDIDGCFRLNGVSAGKRTLRVECLGYTPLITVVTVAADKTLRLTLQPNSFALEGVQVMARRSRGGKVVVDQTALEYIQPTSLADVFMLLPGSVYKENSLTKFSQTSVRQVGTDANTSLGLAVVADGAPVIEDGMRSQMIGITQAGGQYDSEIDKRTGLNQGSDMRLISTDHIQSVTFTRGIASARYGNLSSGMVSIESKHGITPLRARLKADLKNKLLYVGKGFRLGSGTLHAGMDYLHAIDDPREEMDKFNRLTFQAYYNNRLSLWKKPLDIDAKLSQTVTVNKMKKDELTYEYNETYKADYARTALMLKAALTPALSWLHQATLMVSADYTHDKISRHKMVLSGSGPLNVPLAWEEGEHEGAYLPGKYYSDYHTDNQPLNIVAQLNADTRLSLWQRGTLNLLYGLEYTDTKNHGRGAVISNPERPPFPYDNSYMRPRPNYAVPALRNGAGYAQADFMAGSGDVTFLLQAGVRAVTMFNLPGDYYLHGKVMADTRLNASLCFGRKLKNTVRAGYGEETKLPTLDYLYPEKVYKDFYMLNAYTINPAYRHLITWTNVYDIANHQLRANRNRKAEVGWDMDYLGASLSLTAFYERSTRGYEYFSSYRPLTYDLYSQLQPGTDISGRRPEKNDYIRQSYSIFTTMSRVENSSKVTKRGLEYRLTIPQINLLRTSFEVNGAYYQTDYASSLPLQWYPDVKIGGSEYPYVGIYDNGRRNRYRRLNTNFWANTHIRRFRLMVTNFVQMVWLNTSQYEDNHCYTPNAYLGFDGVEREVTPQMKAAILADDGTCRYLRRTILPISYARNEKPFSLLWNIKATKEFGRGTKLSVFVNRLVDVSPKYLSGSKITQREWNDPYFGMELYFNFNL